MDPFPFLKHLSSAPGDDVGGMGLGWLEMAIFSPEIYGRDGTKEISGDGLPVYTSSQNHVFLWEKVENGRVSPRCSRFPFIFRVIFH